MQIPGLSLPLFSPLAKIRAQESSAPAEASSQAEAAKTSGASEAFLAEAKKTPAQRIREEWLARHKLSEEEVQAMDDKKREAVEKDIAEEIKRRLGGKDAPRGALIDAMA